MRSSRLVLFCENLIEAGWLAAIVVTPLYLNLYSSRGIEPDKLALGRSIALVMGLAWMLKWFDLFLSERAARPSRVRSGLFWVTAFLILTQLLATLASVAPRVSFFGAYPRPEGALATISYIIIFALLIQELRTHAQWHRLITTILLTSIPVALYGIIQRLGGDPLQWSGDTANRVGSTMGNPIFLGAYLLIPFFLTIGKLIEHLPKPTIAKWMYGFILILQIAGILLASSRGPFVGWLAGVLFFILLLALFFQRRTWVYTLIGIGVAGLLLLIAVNIPHSPLGVVRDVPVVGRLLNLTVRPGDTATARLLYWDTVARLMSRHAPLEFPDGTPDPLNALRLLIGYGPDTLYLVYHQSYSPGLAYLTPYDSLLDRSHNETWDGLSSTGILGLSASKLFWMMLLATALRALGLMTNRRDWMIFALLWLGGGVIGGIASGVLQLYYLGLAIPLGNLIGLGLYLLARHHAPRSSQITAQPILLMALLAGIIAHYVELQFGLAVIATRVLFWVSAGMIVVLATRPSDPVPELRSSHIPVQTNPTRNELAHVISYGLILGLLSITLLSVFLKYAPGFAALEQIIARALTIPLLGTIAICWGVALALVSIEPYTVNAPITFSTRRWLLLIALGSNALYALALAGLLSCIAQTETSSFNLAQIVERGEQIAILPDFFVGVLFILIGCISLALSMPHWNAKMPWFHTRWVLAIAIPISVLVLFWIRVYYLNPIRADVFHKLGNEYNDQGQYSAAFAMYKRAILLSPTEDYYYLALGRSLAQYAQARALGGSDNPSRLNTLPTPAQVLVQSEQQLDQWSRLDLLYAAQSMLLRARELMPLFPNHTLNLARFYLPEVPVNTETRKQLAKLADMYYAQAIRLAPGNMELWNEWASFDVTYWENPTRALTKLHQAAQRDPLFAPTFVQMGNLYKAQAQPAQAIAAYERALTLQSPPAEAASQVAFLYYQQGRLAEAIAAYQKYIELAPNSEKVWEAYKNLALLYEQKGDRTAALHAAQHARTLAPAELHTQLDEWITRLRQP